MRALCSGPWNTSRKNRVDLQLRVIHEFWNMSKRPFLLLASGFLTLTFAACLLTGTEPIAACKASNCDYPQNHCPMKSSDSLSTINSLELNLTTAEREADEEALAQLLSDDFLGVNQMGQRVDKQSFVNGLCHSGIRFETLDIEDLNIRLTNDTAIVIGRSTFKVVVGEQTVEGTAQFIDTWKQEGEQWRLFAVSVTPERTR